jgi:hypothetical protein
VNQNGAKSFYPGRFLSASAFLIESEKSERKIRYLFLAAYICCLIFPAALRMTVSSLSVPFLLLLSVLFGYVIFFIASHLSAKNLVPVAIDSEAIRAEHVKIWKKQKSQLPLYAIAVAYLIYYQFTDVGGFLFYANFVMIPATIFRMWRLLRCKF